MTMPQITIYKIWMENSQKFWPYSKTGKNFIRISHIKRSINVDNIPDDWYLIILNNGGASTTLLKDALL